ncbi:LysR substrate-binding domain-containing protein [Conexibacter woesei]|uniref:LysR substrate-binding domain-containing protein n=1 Tax=Conexibacter woesei TaxID=191495 RepID=UPI000412E862|nr:LysR substrate-binding domain-containing protein [Conexibacter woesei]
MIGERRATLATVTAMRFTLRQLEYFVAAADAGSVTDAAQNIPVAQSSVSAAISQLEAALGVQLLIRHHAQGISPTAEGRQFLARARALLRDADELERFASELTAELSGTLHLGCLVTLAPLVTPRLGQSFREQHPEVSVDLVEAGQDDLVAGLRSGKLSVALTYDLALTGDLTFAPLASLPPRACFAAGHPLAAQETVTMEQLAAEPLVLLDLPHSRDYFRALFAAAGVEPAVAHRSVHPEVIRTMVANDFGYTIINARPRVDVALDGRPLVTRPIAGDARPMIMGLARLDALRPTRLVEAFEQHARAAIASGAVAGLGDGA